MLRLTIGWGSQVYDYTKCVSQASINVTEQINIPSQLTFSLFPLGTDFIIPPQRAYVRLYSTVTGTSLFTGFISNAPVRTYLAKSQAAPPYLQPDGTVTGDSDRVYGPRQLFQFDITCTSDEYLLNVKAVPFIPAYVNRTQGQILTDLASLLCPGFFDTSNVMDGDIVPFFQYDPTQSWCELAKQFGDGSRYRYKVRDKMIWYTPYGDQPLGIYYDEVTQKSSQLSPKDLATTVLTVPIVNDVTIIGDTEAGNNWENYFCGTGYDANIPLLYKVFHGAETLLLQESWNNNDLSAAPSVTTQQWTLEDPGDNFDFTAGALNVTDTLSAVFDLGFSWLQMNNGLELAGGIDTQVGECIFEDFSQGVLGGIYVDASFGASGLLAGFAISSPSGVVTSASGAAGVVIQPWFCGSSGGFVPASGVTMDDGTLNPAGNVGSPVVSEINHTYVLQVVIHAPQYVRYNQVFRTIEGEEYGGAESEMQANITWNIQDYDIQAATGFFYTPEVTTTSVQNVALPAFGVYALVNNQKLNVSITNTTIGLMPLGGLGAIVGPSGLFTPTGSILPMLPNGSGEFIGAVQPWADVAASSGIFAGPYLLDPTATQQVQVMGNGFDLQAAQITQGNSTDTLAFYAQSTPAAGTPVRYQSWEAQAAVSRLQMSGSIVTEAYVVGDDGIRSAIVNNLNPLPRTAEDCDNAALAFLTDRVSTYYNGTYSCTSLFFNGLSSDVQYYPTVGRFFNVNAPRRDISQQKFLVTQLQITMLDMMTELVQYAITFGADLNLEKVLANFVDLQPLNVLTPNITTNPPNPRFTQDVDNTFLPDLNNTQLDLEAILPDSVTVNVSDPYYGAIEARRLDTNWGRGPTSDWIGTYYGPSWTMARQQYDQVWYMRPVGPSFYIIAQMAAFGDSFTIDQWAFYLTQLTGIVLTDPPQIEIICTYAGVPYDSRSSTNMTLTAFLNGAVLAGALAGQYVITSRRSKVLRVRWPLRPAVPLFVNSQEIQAPGPGGAYVSTISFQLNYNGDQRNIYGFEVRAADNATILVQAPATSYADMFVDLSQTPFLYLDPPLNSDYNLYCYFFNQNWRYSQPLILSLNPEGAMWPWSPGYEAPVAGDNEFTAYGFGAAQQYIDDAAGNPIATELIQGVPPPNQMTTAIGPPVIQVAVSQGSGGTIKPGTYAIGVSAYDQPPAAGTNFGVTALSNIVNVVVTADNSAFYVGVDWDEGSVGGGLFVASPDQWSGWHWEEDIDIDATGAFLTEVSGQAYGAPDPRFDHFVLKFKKEIYSGLELTLLGVSGSTVAVSASGFSVNQWAGYTMSLLGYDNIDNNVAILDLPIASNTANTLTFSTGPDLTTVLNVGDVVTIRMSLQDITADSFGDPNLVNAVNLSGALSTDITPGDIAWIIAGPGYGQTSPISAVAATGITLGTEWAVIPTSGSLIIIVEPTWTLANPTQSYPTRNSFTVSGQVAEPALPNLSAQTWVMIVLTADTNGNVSLDQYSPIREIHFFGQPGVGTQDVTYTNTPVAYS